MLRSFVKNVLKIDAILKRFFWAIDDFMGLWILVYSIRIINIKSRI